MGRKLTDPGGGDPDDGPSFWGDAYGGIGRGRASAVHGAAALEREGERSRGFCAVLLGGLGLGLGILTLSPVSVAFLIAFCPNAKRVPPTGGPT